MAILPEHIVSLTMVGRFRLFWFTSVFILFGFCIWIVHAMERFFGIDVVYASTRYTQKGCHGCDSLSWIYNYLCNQCLSPLKFEFEPRTWRGVLDTTL
jgi:hypothetical protein